MTKDELKAELTRTITDEKLIAATQSVVDTTWIIAHREGFSEGFSAGQDSITRPIEAVNKILGLS